MKHQGFWAIGGLVLGFFLCWWNMVLPLEVRLDAREKSLQEWERINRMEREAIANIKTINIEQLRKWVSTLSEQNARYTELLTLLHKQELALNGLATTHLWIALIAVVGTAAYVSWIVKDSNADAARTLYNAVAILPSLKEAIQGRVEMSTATSLESGQVLEFARDRHTSPTLHGTIVKYTEDKRYGFISPDLKGNDLFFHRDQISDSSKCESYVGKRVSYQIGFDSRRRSCARNIRVLAD